MRPRLDVSGIEASVSFDTVLSKVKEYSYSRLPVYKNNLDEIIGILHTKDLLPYLNNEEMDWHPLMRRFFMYMNKNL